jgi:hypothetical protein
MRGKIHNKDIWKWLNVLNIIKKKYKIWKEAARLCGLNADKQTITNIVHVNCKVITRKMQANQKMAM